MHYGVGGWVSDLRGLKISPAFRAFERFWSPIQDRGAYAGAYAVPFCGNRLPLSTPMIGLANLGWESPCR